MSSREFVRKLKRHARKCNLDFEIKKHESKGSHRRIYVGGRKTTIPWRNELRTGLVRAVLKQLNMNPREISDR